MHVVATEAEADRLISERQQARAYKRALRKSLTGEDLSANEAAALAARQAPAS